jgi:hypothetical protein
MVALLAAAGLSAACAPESREYGPPEPDASGCAAALVCDDFEALTPQAVPMGELFATAGSGSVVVDTTRAWSGKNSVKLSTTAGSDFKTAMLTYGDPGVQPSQGNIYYGRMMFWLESAPAQAVTWTIIAGAGLVPGESYHANYRYGGHDNQLQAAYETPDSYDTPPIGPSTACWDDSAQLVPTGTWTCAEWKFDGERDQMQLWLEGVEIPDLHMQGTGEGCTKQPASYQWTAPTFTQLYVGWESYSVDEPRTIWIDDVALSTQRTGCPAPP